MLHFDSSHPIVTRGPRVSRAQPYNTLPAFLILNGSWERFNEKNSKFGNLIEN